MRREGAAEPAVQVLPLNLIALLLLSALCAGCDHYCVSFFSNQSAGTVSINNPTCSLDTKTNGMIRVRSTASPALRAKWGTIGVQHIFISVRSIELHASPAAGEGSSPWLELAPSLAKKHLQVDLMAATEDSAPSIIVDNAAIPSGGYTAVRLLLVSDRPPTDEPSSEANSCGSVGFNCIITNDGNVHPLLLAGEEPQILIPSARSDRGMFYVLPNTTTNLELEFSLDSSVVLAPGRALWLDPVFKVRSEFSPDSGEISGIVAFRRLPGTTLQVQP